jgi:glutamate--cysteine ligase
MTEQDPDEPVTDLDAAYGFVTRICFKIGPPRLLGLELEWLLADPRDHAVPLELSRLATALGPYRPDGLGSVAGPVDPGASGTLPRRSLVTVEPGGQVELSTVPCPSLPELVAAADADADALHAQLAAGGLRPLDVAADPWREPHRLRRTDRYDAMEAAFDRRGPAGRTMMCSTAAVQLNLDAGTEHGPDSFVRRWHALHVLGPALVAMFANSAWAHGRSSGWKSARQAAWLAIDPARTAPPSGHDPREAYARAALDAPLLIAAGGGRLPPRVSMRDWIGGALDSPVRFADLRYHLTTLFPPVRAQGHFEVRYLDAQAGRDWVVVAAVVAALLSSSRVRDEAVAVALPTAGRWTDAARLALDDPELAECAAELMRLVLGADLPAPIAAQVAAFAERYTFRGRCPADDWAGGPPLAVAEGSTTIEGSTTMETR